MLMNLKSHSLKLGYRLKIERIISKSQVTTTLSKVMPTKYASKISGVVNSMSKDVSSKMNNTLENVSNSAIGKKLENAKNEFKKWWTK